MLDESLTMVSTENKKRLMLHKLTLLLSGISQLLVSLESSAPGRQQI